MYGMLMNKTSVRQNFSCGVSLSLSTHAAAQTARENAAASHGLLSAGRYFIRGGGRS